MLPVPTRENDLADRLHSMAQGLPSTSLQLHGLDGVGRAGRFAIRLPAMLRFLTAGESHGPELVAVIEGAPAGFEIDIARINHDLARRQKGYGRGGRMLIEKDEARIVSGIRFGRTMGSPVTFIVENRDYKNWEKRMSADPRDRGEAKVVTRPRPGHADLAGVLKYNLEDIRDVLERASARETTARVAIGAFARQILTPFGVQVLGYVVSIGSVQQGLYVYEWGEAKAHFPNGKNIQDRYLTVWQEQPDGTWKIFRNLVIPNR